jgi:micrococcal nuclease
MEGKVYEYRAEVVRWVDGDTVDLLVDLGFTVLLRQRFRLLGVDTPETNRKASREAGKAAHAYAESLAPVGSVVLVRSRKTGKFGRWLADVYPLGGDGDPLVSVNEALLEAGHAREYPG